MIIICNLLTRPGTDSQDQRSNYPHHARKQRTYYNGIHLHRGGAVAKQASLEVSVSLKYYSTIKCI